MCWEDLHDDPPHPRACPQVRSQSVQEIVPAYEAFYEEFSTADFSINKTKYVRYR